jgi:hypothetical protein
MATRRRQLLVQVTPTARGLGSSDSANLQKAFPASPISSGELTDEKVIQDGQRLLIEGVVNDGGHTFGTFDRDYPESPDLAQVEIGGAGKPGSPYAPNIASPGEGMNPASIPESGVAATENAKGTGSPFPGDGLESPKPAAARISKQTIGVGKLKYGSSEPQG